jgi:4-amino-4-deoxychorismate lyase
MPAFPEPYRAAGPLFLESVKALGGEYHNLGLHQARINRASRAYGLEGFVLADILPKPPPKGLFKLRLLWPFPPGGARFEFVPYQFPKLDALRLIEHPGASYPHKYIDRRALSALKAVCGASDFILTQNGLVTDSSVANLVFQNGDGLFTPDSFLLPGVKRAALLRRGAVRERRITAQDISSYDKVFFINAMIDIEDGVSLPADKIIRG